MVDFSTLLIGGVPLMLVVFGMVSFLKSMGLTGKALTAASLVLGVIFGLLFQLSIKIPGNLPEWIGAVFFGLAVGVVASGVYDQMTRWVKIVPSE